MPNYNYDVAFIGAGIAGLYAAALLAQAGRKVVLVDPGEKAGGAVTERVIDRFQFIGGPNIGYGFEPRGPAQALCAALNLSADDISTAFRFQVALPDHRVTIAPDVQETLTELRREFPREIDKLSQIYRETSMIAQKASTSGLSSFILKQRSAAAYFRNRDFSRELIAYFDVQSRFFFGHNIQSLPLSSLVLLLTTPPRIFPIGFGTVADRLLSTIEDRKGSLRLREKWPALTFRRRRISAVRTSQEVIEPRTVVINAAWRPQEHAMFIGVREEVIPVGMECAVISLPDYGQPEEMISLTLSRDGSNSAPVGMRTLTAVFFGPTLPNTSVETRIERIRSIIPFLSEFSVITDEHGHQEREYVLPNEVIVSPYRPGNKVELPVPNSISNLYILPDSSRALYQTLQAGAHLANKL